MARSTTPIARHKRCQKRIRAQYFDGRINRAPLWFMSSNDAYVDYLRQEEAHERAEEARIARAIDRTNMSREDLAMEAVEAELDEVYGFESECERNLRLEGEYLDEVAAKGWAL